MVTFSYDNLVKIISDYKKEFAKRFPGEIYKWKAVKHFQEHWDIYICSRFQRHAEAGFVLWQER